MLGLLYFGNDKIFEAIEALQNSLRLNPANAGAMYTIAEIYYQLNNDEAGDEYMMKAAELGYKMAIEYLQKRSESSWIE